MATARHAVMSLALMATVAATAWFAMQEDPAADAQELLAAPPPRVAAAARMVAASQAAAAPAAMALAGVPRFAKAGGDLFAVRHWQKASPLAGVPAPVVAPAPEPPPALPFRYLGKLVEGGEVVVFLAQGDQQIHLVRRGDVLAGYRVDALRADGMHFTHLARNAPYDLAFGSGN